MSRRSFEAVEGVCDIGHQSADIYVNGANTRLFFGVEFSRNKQKEAASTDEIHQQNKRNKTMSQTGRK